MTTSDEHTLGALLRRWRERALLTQEQLAEKTGLSTRTIRRMEQGGPHRPRSSSLRLLGEALGLGPAELALLAAAARGRLPRAAAPPTPRSTAAPAPPSPQSTAAPAPPPRLVVRPGPWPPFSGSGWSPPACATASPDCARRRGR
ncbi:helix-turn-helix domain-containing protein [Actinomadura sp. ATCC 31491]|uniref:Helix-turn-helix domain-containing protein n=1 Tax=Actinomadura luzonensis TaxID=2805427 RepID=A0ABT0FUE7_9ACTN|nr:helix-turn-helix transcriptional regulator [Actinomadura luzonensis]MCK2215960.1 helix-turn-helix domain-containing protein [Actinomadura luzonensis]